MKKLGTLFIVLVCLLNSNMANASHLMGGEITWKCVGQDSFLVKVVVYTDCNSAALSSAPINLYCANTNTLLSSLSIGVGTPIDITPVCKSSCTRCVSGSCSFPYGIHKYTMQGIANLGAAGSCCNIRIAWQMSSRNTNITTTSTTGDLYVEAKLNRCLNPCDNSPSFSNEPIEILCVAQDFNYTLV